MSLVMNDRIKELAEQAGFRYINDERIGWAGNYNSSLGKFAELILKQCLSYVDDSFGDVDYVKFMIKRDFGVEE